MHIGPTHRPCLQTLHAFVKIVFMKKHLFLCVFCFVFLTGFTGSEPMNERIIIDGDRRTYYNFPSTHLDYRRNVRFILPEGYFSSGKNYPVLYLLDGINTENSLPVDGFIRVVVEPKEEDQKQPFAFAKFIVEDLVLYTDLNFRTDASPQARRLQAQGGAATAALAAWNENIFGHLFLYDIDGVHPISPVNKNHKAVFVYFEGNKSDAYLLDNYFTEQGLEYGKNLFYNFDGNKFICPSFSCAVKPAKFKLTLDRRALPPGGESAQITGIYGKFNFIVKEEALRLSPPVLNFNEARQTLSPIAGSSPGKVKITARGAKTSLTIGKK